MKITDLSLREKVLQTVMQSSLIKRLGLYLVLMVELLFLSGKKVKFCLTTLFLWQNLL